MYVDMICRKYASQKLILLYGFYVLHNVLFVYFCIFSFLHRVFICVPSCTNFIINKIRVLWAAIAGEEHGLNYRALNAQYYRHELLVQNRYCTM